MELLLLHLLYGHAVLEDSTEIEAFRALFRNSDMK